MKLTGKTASSRSLVCLPFLGGKKTLKVKTVVGQAGIDQCRHKGSSTRKALHFHPHLNALSDQQKPGIRNTGCNCIRDQSYRFPCQNAGSNLFNHFMLIKLVVGLHAGLNVKMLQQMRSGTCVLRKNQITLFQNPEGSQCDVF